MSSSDNPQSPAASSESGEQPSASPELLSLAPIAEVPQSGASIAALPSPRDPVWSGWDVSLLALLTLFTLIVSEFATVMVAMFLIHPGSNFRDLLQSPSLDLIGEIIGYVAVAAFMIMLVEGKYRTPFWQAIHWNWRSQAIPKFLGIGVLTVSLDLLSRYLPMPKTTPFEQFFSHPGDAYLIAVFAVSFGPLMEELFFRGFLYPVLARRTGVFLAVILTSIPFGFLHYLQYRSWAAVLVITMVGVVLTVVRVITNSVAASFVVHVGYNATLMVLTAIATDGFRHMEKITSIVARIR